MTGDRSASPRFRPRRLDGVGSLGHLRCSPAFGRGPAHPPEAGGCPRTPTPLGCSVRFSVLRFARRDGSSDSLGKASPVPVSPILGRV